MSTTYEEVETRALAGDDLAIAHLAWWDRCNAVEAAEADLSKLKARLSRGDDRVTATMLTKADAEIVRCEALRNAAFLAHETAKQRAPKDPVLAKIVSAALESVGLPMEPDEHRPYLTVTPKDRPQWDYISGHATGMVSVVYTATEWHRAITADEILKAVTASPLTAGVSVDGAGSHFTVRLIGHRSIPELYELDGAESWTWSNAKSGLTYLAQSALLTRYGTGRDDYGDTGEPRVRVSGLTFTRKGEVRDGDLLHRTVEVTVGSLPTSGVNRGEANGVVRDALLGTVGHLWSGLGAVEAVEPVEAQTLVFTIVCRAKAGRPEHKTFTHERLGA